MQKLFSHGPNGDAGLHILGRPVGLVLIIAYKGIWGAVELAIGVSIFFLARIALGELAEDPQDLFFNWLLRHTHIDFHTTWSVGLMVVFLGCTKVALAIGLWFELYAVRTLGLILFSVFTLFGLYELTQDFATTRLLVVIIEALSLLYFWKILPRHLRRDPVARKLRK